MSGTMNAKIIATVGPRCSDRDVLRKLIAAGADTIRIDFSDGDNDSHAATVQQIRALEAELGHPVGILQDLQGPEINLGLVPDVGVSVRANTLVRFTLHEPYSELCFPLPHPEVFAAIRTGDQILIDNGHLRLDVKSHTEDYISARAITDGLINSHSKVNLPRTLIDQSPLTSKDRKDLKFGLSLDVDWVALSAVQQTSDLVEARTLINDQAKLIAKIEKLRAFDQIDGIVAMSDAIMISRADLGVETSPEEVPGRQKELIAASRKAGKPVIVATQMLESMVGSPAPTRAEASDLATAIYDGADAVLLSAETSMGRYPVISVEIMNRIISQTERHRLYMSLMKAAEPEVEPMTPHAVAGAAASLAKTLSASAVVAFTVSGATAARVARERPPVPIVVMASTIKVARQLRLLWGALTMHSPDVESYDETIDQAIEGARQFGLAGPGTTLVVVAGAPIGVRGKTNNIRVVTVE